MAGHPPNAVSSRDRVDGQDEKRYSVPGTSEQVFHAAVGDREAWLVGWGV